MKGYFISFAAGEGCGKSKQIKRLKDDVASLKNVDNFVFVKEPGGTPLTDELRRLILDYEVDSPLPMTELLLLCASRVENVQKRILPALSQGKVVIADRFYDSTIAYQCSARGIMPVEDLLALTKKIIGDVKPDLTFYFKLSPEEAFARKNKMEEKLDRIESEGLEFHHKVQAGYDYISKVENDRFYTIDASKSPEEIFSEILKVLKEKIPQFLN